MSLVLNEPFIQVQTLPPSMQHKCKEMIDFVRKTTMEIIGDQLPTQSPSELKDNSNVLEH